MGAADVDRTTVEHVEGGGVEGHKLSLHLFSATDELR